MYSLHHVHVKRLPIKIALFLISVTKFFTDVQRRSANLSRQKISIPEGWWKGTIYKQN